MFHHPFQDLNILSHDQFSLTPEELFMDMELCYTKKELDALFLATEPTSVLDLSAHISPLNSPSSDTSSAFFQDFSSTDPWKYEDHVMDFDLDLLSPTSTSSGSSDLTLQDDASNGDEHRDMLEELLLGDDYLEDVKTLELQQQQQDHGGDVFDPEGDLQRVHEDDQEVRSDEKRGLDIVHLLLASVEHIQQGDQGTARMILQHLVSSINHPLHLASPIERVATHISRALEERINSPDDQFVAAATAATSEEADEDLAFARRSFYQHFPFVKFAHFTANQAILESSRGCSKLHIVDFDIDQGLQWPSLIQALSQIPEQHSPSLRITGVGSSLDDLHNTGRRLADFAASIGYNKLDFHPVRVESPDQIDPSTFSRSIQDEDDQSVALAVNCSMFLHRLLGNQPALERTLDMIRGWRPRVVAVTEIEASHDSPSFVDRFVEVLHFYSAVFDCLESVLERMDMDRICIESAMFGQEIRDILACERGDRVVRHSRSENWRELMRWAGFQDAGLSDHSLYQAHIFLALYSQAYRLTREAESLILGWGDTPVVSVSTWSC